MSAPAKAHLGDQPQSDTAQSEQPGQTASDPGRPRSMVFRRRRNVVRQAPEESRRQSEIIQLAWRHFRDSAPMIAFLNTRHDALNGQPLHLAIESDEGLERVQRLLKQLTFEA